MRVLIAILLASLPSGYGAAQQPQPGFPGGGLWQHPPDRMVPITIVDGVMIASGSISGGGGKEAGPLAFVVDTAATSTVIDIDAAHRAGWSGGKGAPYKNRTLELAGASVGDRPVFALNLSSMAKQLGEAVGGIAGSDIFQHFAVRVDYVRHGLTLTLPESCATPEKKLRLRLVGGLPFVEASVAAPGGTAVQGMFLVDTGQAGTGLILTSEFLRKHPELGQKQAHLPYFDSAGKVQPTAFLRLGSLQLGDAALKDVVATVAPPAGGDSGLAGVIGGGVLSRFDLLVDMPRHWLTLTPNADYGAPFEADMSGILLLSGEPNGRSGEGNGRLGDRVYTIAAIAEKSPASEAGLQQGDRLVSIGDRKVNDMSMDQVRGILKSTPGTKVVVGIDRSGKGLQVTLTLRRAV
jgi:hypothetical protein